eukprot:1142212-Pelagomonas_calceolata.AAC.3
MPGLVSQSATVFSEGNNEDACTKQEHCTYAVKRENNITYARAERSTAGLISSHVQATLSMTGYGTDL